MGWGGFGEGGKGGVMRANFFGGAVGWCSLRRGEGGEGEGEGDGMGECGMRGD